MFLYPNEFKSWEFDKEASWIWTRRSRRRSSSTWISWAMQAGSKAVTSRRSQKPTF